MVVDSSAVRFIQRYGDYFGRRNEARYGKPGSAQRGLIAFAIHEELKKRGLEGDTTREALERAPVEWLIEMEHLIKQTSKSPVVQVSGPRVEAPSPAPIADESEYHRGRYQAKIDHDQGGVGAMRYTAKDLANSRYPQTPEQESFAQGYIGRAAELELVLMVGGL